MRLLLLPILGSGATTAPRPKASLGDKRRLSQFAFYTHPTQASVLLPLA